MVAPRTDSTERELHGGCSKARDVDAALRERAVCAVLAVVDQSQEQVDGARPCGAHSRRKLAGPLYSASERIGLLVGGGSRRLEENLGS
jgi:hypothetical protein